MQTCAPQPSRTSKNLQLRPEAFWSKIQGSVASTSCDAPEFLGHCGHAIPTTGLRPEVDLKLTWTKRAVRPDALSFAGAITTSPIAAAPARHALASETLSRPLDGFVTAQTSMDSPDPPPAPSRPAPPQIPAPPKTDYVPPSPARISAPLPSRPNAASTDIPWGASGFTADGSYSSNWKTASQAEAEAMAAKGCAQFGRGACQVVSFSGQQSAALATLIASYRHRHWNLSFTAGGATDPEAQGAAIGRRNADVRSQARCRPRTAACADGR
jgi:hypothetical protein